MDRARVAQPKGGARPGRHSLQNGERLIAGVVDKSSAVYVRGGSRMHEAAEWTIRLLDGTVLPN